MTDRDSLETNRKLWDALAEVHGQDNYYDTEALIGGRDSLNDEESAAVCEAVGDPAGLDVVHIQCHIGFDTISLARRGARVTGVDFSSASLAKAARIADAAGVEVAWVHADAMSLPATLAGRFDLAYATSGVLCWIGDIDAWMRSAASVLRRGGRLLLSDGHPLTMMIADEGGFALDYPYAFDGPHHFDEDGSYADPEAKLAATESYQYAHSVGEIVTAAVGAGLQIVSLTEHLAVGHHIRPQALTREEDGLLRLRVDGQMLPVTLTLIAQRS